MKYILTTYLFGAINVVVDHYKVGQTQHNLT